MRLGVGGGGVPERPVGVVILPWIEPDEYLAAWWAVLAISEKSPHVDDLAEDRATDSLLGRDIGGVNLDVLGGEGLRKSPFGLLVSSSNSFPSHPENEQSQDESPKHNGDNGEHSQDDIVV